MEFNFQNLPDVDQNRDIIQSTMTFPKLESTGLKSPPFQEHSPGSKVHRMLHWPTILLPSSHNGMIPIIHRFPQNRRLPSFLPPQNPARITHGFTSPDGQDTQPLCVLRGITVIPVPRYKMEGRLRVFSIRSRFRFCESTLTPSKRGSQRKRDAFVLLLFCCLLRSIAISRIRFSSSRFSPF